MAHFLPGGHEVLEVNNLAENLHLGLLINLLLAHSTSDLAGSLFDTADNSMRELVLFGGRFVNLNENSLLTSVFTIKNDNNLTGLKTLDHLELIRIHSIEKIYTDSFKLEYIFGEKQLVQHSREINPPMRKIL